jgi:hypothetical protein
MVACFTSPFITTALITTPGIFHPYPAALFTGAVSDGFTKS